VFGKGCPCSAKTKGETRRGDFLNSRVIKSRGGVGWLYRGCVNRPKNNAGLQKKTHRPLGGGKKSSLPKAWWARQQQGKKSFDSVGGKLARGKTKTPWHHGRLAHVHKGGPSAKRRCGVLSWKGVSGKVWGNSKCPSSWGKGSKKKDGKGVKYLFGKTVGAEGKGTG